MQHHRIFIIKEGKKNSHPLRLNQNVSKLIDGVGSSYYVTSSSEGVPGGGGVEQKQQQSAISLNAVSVVVVATVIGRGSGDPQPGEYIKIVHGDRNSHPHSPSNFLCP